MTDLVFKRLLIENFKAYRGKHEFRLDLAAGLYYVTGQNKRNPRMGANGIAKSTIWDALFWCLYGRTIEGGQATLIDPWGISERTRVVVWFERDGQNSKVRRTRRPNGLVHNSGVGDDTVVEQPFIDNAVGMDADTARHTIFIGQFSDLFMDLRPGDQASMFTRVLQLDRWIGLAAKAKAEADKAQGIVDQCELALASAQGKLEEAEGQLSFARGERDKWGEEQAKICVRTAEALSEAQAKADKAKKALRLAKSQREAFDEKAKDRLERARQLAEAKSAADGKLLLAINARDSARMAVERYKGAKKCPECGKIMKRWTLKKGTNA